MDSRAVIDPVELVGKIEQKAIQLSGLLRDWDNHPTHLSDELCTALSDTLEMLACRVAASQALCRVHGDGVLEETSSMSMAV